MFTSPRKQMPKIKSRSDQYKDRRWLAEHSFNLQYEGQKKPELSSANTLKRGRAKRLAAFQQRRELLEPVADQFKMAFRVDEAPEIKIRGKVLSLSYKEFLQFEKDDYGDYITYTNKPIKAISKPNRPYQLIHYDLVKYALEQYGMSACLTDHLVQYYSEETRVAPQLFPNKQDSQRAKQEAFGSRDPSPADPISEYADFNDTPGVAEKVTSQIKSCMDNYKAGSGPRFTIVPIQQCSIDGENGDHSKHENIVVLDLQDMTAQYYEPHTSTASEGWSIPYYQIQTAICGFFTVLGFQCRLSPTGCPLQGQDSLCASWSFYLAVSATLNPQLSAEQIIASTSYADIFRMLYVLYTRIPLSRSSSLARRTDTNTTYMIKDGKGKMQKELSEGGFMVPIEIQTQLLKTV